MQSACKNSTFVEENTSVSGLQILKKYSCLWHTHLSASQRPDLYIVNLMWTPKDESATIKINGMQKKKQKREISLSYSSFFFKNLFRIKIFFLCVAGRCDDVMKIVMQRLGYRVPKYQKYGVIMLHFFFFFFFRRVKKRSRCLVVVFVAI